MLLAGCQMATSSIEPATESGTTADGAPGEQTSVPSSAPSQVTIADANVTEGEGDGSMRFPVSLEPATGSAVTVEYATADVTASAGADYAGATGTLTFPAGTTARTIAVPIVDDQAPEDAETFTVTLSSPVSATLSGTAATGTIRDNDGGEEHAPLELSSLQVTGGESEMYPAFAADIYHYALACTGSDTLRVQAEALNSSVDLTLLRANPIDNHESVGSLDVEVAVNMNHDLAIEMSASGATATYVVHCLPTNFPDITVLKKSEGASEGLLFVTPESFTGRTVRTGRYLAIIDYNGVPRFHQRGGGKNFRPYANGMTIDGRRVRYSHGTATLLDENLAEIRRVSTPAGNQHEFLITDDGTFLFVVYQPYVDDPDDAADDRDFSPFPDVTSTENMKDGVIREVDTNGNTVFEWNSWDHINLDDCGLKGSVGDYSHLNSLHMVGGDVVGSFKGCSQVLRIDRSAGTGTVEWQLGGTTPTRSTQTHYLEIVNDDAGEICSQHSAIVTNSGSVLLFDNGDGCLGARKEQAQFTRVVEYDISSGTEAVLLRKAELPPEQGYADFGGSVRELENGNWLISWGRTSGNTVSADQFISISEVAPDGTSVFEMNMSKSPDFVHSYRAYREAEADVTIPWNLP